MITCAGLATEFMTQKEAEKYYGKSGPNEYSKIVQDFHRSRYNNTSLYYCIAVRYTVRLQVGER